MPTREENLRPDPAARRAALRWLVLLDAAVRLTVWTTSFAAASWVVSLLGIVPERGPFSRSPIAAVKWAWFLSAWLLLFNVTYLLTLVGLRALVPTPREGAYETEVLGGDRNIVWAVIAGILTWARLTPAAPGFLVQQLCGLPPLCWLVERVMGPRTKSAWFLQPKVMDAYLVDIGANVVIGYGAIISPHAQVRETFLLKRIVIEDDVLIGANSIVMGGTRIGKGAMIGAGAIVPPDTQIGANEFWGGVPAKKIRDLPALCSRAAAS